LAAAGSIVAVDSKRRLVLQPLQFRGHDCVMHRPECDAQPLDGARNGQTPFARKAAQPVIPQLEQGHAYHPKAGATPATNKMHAQA
jgi:hypothetical protein